MIVIRKSIKDDIQELKKTVLESFVQASINDYGNAKMLPPGVTDGSVIINGFEGQTIFTLLWDNKIVGGMIIELKDSKENYLQTIWIIPEYQNKGIGKKAIEFLETTFPDTISWFLETLSLAKGNKIFYEKLGYRIVGEQRFEDSPVVLINYKKDMPS